MVISGNLGNLQSQPIKIIESFFFPYLVAKKMRENKIRFLLFNCWCGILKFLLKFINYYFISHVSFKYASNACQDINEKMEL